MAMNLIPQLYRDDFKYERMRGFVLYIGAITLCLLVIWVTLLLPSYFYLSTQLAVVQNTNQEAETIRQEQIQKLSQEIAEVNTVLTTVAGLKRQQGSTVVVLLTEVMERTGSGIRYQSVSVSGGEVPTMSLQGTASTRRQLQALKADMEASPMIELADIPSDRFTEIENISFTMSITFSKP